MQGSTVDLTMVTTSDVTDQKPIEPTALSSKQCMVRQHTDKHGTVYAKAKYPHISGLQSLVLAEKFAFIPQPDEFVQILNVSSNHWILISTIGCPPATVNVYDSLHGTLPARA